MFKVCLGGMCPVRNFGQEAHTQYVNIWVKGDSERMDQGVNTVNDQTYSGLHKSN